MKPPLIIDASVALKWFLQEGEEDLSEAQALLQNLSDVTLYAPQHFFIEVGATLYRKQKSLAKKELLALMEMGIILVKCHEALLTIADRLIKKYEVSLYDASYHALALYLSGTLITADQKYFKTTRKEGGVMLLKHYKNEFIR